ncbi:MAG: septal ring lytic transglycosylase RlpA family protein [Hydrogenophaga sp.]|jgi:rare lipoprotein A
MVMAWRRLWTLTLATTLWLGGCATQAPPVVPPPVAPQPAEPQEIARGLASWYGEGFHGRATASGERFDLNALTAAHRTLPIGSRVRVRNLANGKEVVVRINDRGPHIGGRLIDLSRAAAAQIGLLNSGVAAVVLLREPAP